MMKKTHICAYCKKWRQICNIHLKLRGHVILLRSNWLFDLSRCPRKQNITARD